MQTATTSSFSPSTSEPWECTSGARNRIYITTSWDDGSPLDWRVADLLAKYEIRGTFYIPRSSQRPTMSDDEVRKLAVRFDVGAHTLDHVPLTTLLPDEVQRQLDGSKQWLEDLTGRECSCFCPPLGRLHRQHLPQIRSAGFRVVRTVELLSLDLPRYLDQLTILPTTIQAYPHFPSSYLKNALRRAAVSNLFRYLRHGIGADWTQLCRAMLGSVLDHGGVFHLWGHSWEIEEMGQWDQLDEVLRMISSHTKLESRLSNNDLQLKEFPGRRQLQPLPASAAKCSTPLLQLPA